MVKQIFILQFFILSLNVALAQEFLKMRDVNDFNIGDEFHFQSHKEEATVSQGPVTDELENILITGKTFSIAYDTVFYTQKLIHRIIRSGVLWDTIMIEQVYYTNLDRTTKDITGYQGSTPNLTDAKIFNGRIRNSFSDGDFNGSHGLEYSEGLGLTRSWGNYSGQGNSIAYKRDLVYFKKGGEEWGTRVPVIPRDPAIKNSSILIYPNPAHDRTTLVKEGMDRAVLILSDFQGHKILTDTFEGQIMTLPTGILIPGIYFITIVGEAKADTAVLIIK
ncbi:MAG: T9SS type A sorting domain-containing protein [Bacteroidales bacterium]|nr:T9SS type A sorting domain-containing protein [Bacteroidales bacterium]